MKRVLDIFVELGRRVATGVPTEVAEQAVDNNNWFTPSDIAYAAEAIRAQMLSHEGLSRWMERYPTLPTTSPQRILIIMAGNIPLVGFFDLLCVVMAGHSALVKLSHKDRILMEWIISLILDIEPSTPIYYYREGEHPDRVIATGGDAAVAYFKENFRDTPTLIRGSRHSIAVLNERPCDGLSEDVYRYSGLGCRNVSLIFKPRGRALPHLAPRDENPKYRNNYLQNRALLTLSKSPFEDSGFSCIIEQESLPSQISTLAVVEYDSVSEVEQWIAAHDDELQCIVAHAETLHHPRRADFGEAQRPTLNDYADGVDTMIFLN